MNCELCLDTEAKAEHEIINGAEVLAICCQCHEQCQTENWHEKDKEIIREMLSD